MLVVGGLAVRQPTGGRQPAVEPIEEGFGGRVGRLGAQHGVDLDAVDPVLEVGTLFAHHDQPDSGMLLGQRRR